MHITYWKVWGEWTIAYGSFSFSDRLWRCNSSSLIVPGTIDPMED